MKNNCLECCNCALQFGSFDKNGKEIRFYRCLAGNFYGSYIAKERLTNCNMFNTELTEDEIEQSNDESIY